METQNYKLFSEDSRTLTELLEKLNFAVGAVMSGRVPTETGDADFLALQNLMGVDDADANLKGFMTDLSPEVRQGHDASYFVVEVFRSEKADTETFFKKILAKYPGVGFEPTDQRVSEI